MGSYVVVVNQIRKVASWAIGSGEIDPISSQCDVDVTGGLC